MKRPNAKTPEEFAAYTFSTPHNPSQYGQTTILILREDWDHAQTREHLHAVIHDNRDNSDVPVTFTTAITLDGFLAGAVKHMLLKKGVEGLLGSTNKQIPVALKSAFEHMNDRAKKELDHDTEEQLTDEDLEELGKVRVQNCIRIQWIGASRNITNIYNSEDFVQKFIARRLAKHLADVSHEQIMEDLTGLRNHDRVEEPVSPIAHAGHHQDLDRS